MRQFFLGLVVRHLGKLSHPYKHLKEVHVTYDP